MPENYQCMTYKDGTAFMYDLCKNIKWKTQLYSQYFIPYPGILIRYPGKKKAIGDYQVSYNEGQVPTHPDICQYLYDLILKNSYSFVELSNFLDDIYTEGTNTRYTDTNLEFLKNLIFWTTLQEQINYPYGAGIRLPFCRYYESICSATGNYDITLNTVMNRCNNHGRVIPELYNYLPAKQYYY